MANNLLRKPSLRPPGAYSPKVDRLSLPSPALTRSIRSLADLPTASPSIQRLMDMGMRQQLCSENVLKSATLAQLRLLQEEVVTWVARRQAEPLLRLKFDNVTKRVPVAAVGRSIPASSFHAAWGLPSAVDDYIEFVGLRGPDGVEIVFEEVEDASEPMLVNWEEHIREDSVYLLLYLDAREDLADLLTEDERHRILEEFDSMDVNGSGIVTTQEMQHYAEKLLVRDLAALKAELDDLTRKGDAGKKIADEKERLLRQTHAASLEALLASDIDEDGTVELHEFFRARCVHVLQARGVPTPTKRRMAGGVFSPRSSMGALSPPRAGTADGGHSPAAAAPAAFCPNCGKAFISAFCTGCGTSRGGGGGTTAPSSVTVVQEAKKVLKKKVKRKGSDKGSGRGKPEPAAEEEEEEL